MFRRLKRIFTYTKLNAINDNSNNEKQNSNKVSKIPKSINKVRAMLEDRFSESSDFILRELLLGKDSSTHILIAYIDGMVNNQLINSDIIKPIMIECNSINPVHSLKDKSTLNLLKEKLISTSYIKEVNSFDESVASLLSGDTMIFIDNCDSALKASLRLWDKRSVGEPTTNVVIRGPREGFTETLRTNTILLRRKIKNSNLKFETMTVGEQTNTEICICYIKGIASDDTIKTVKERIGSIKTDAILESGYIEEFIQDSKLGLFPTVGNSEKPDVVAGKLLEGRVAILCDGTPFVLTVPYLFVEAIQSSEDYYTRSIYATMSRFVRIIALVITVFLPAFYVALVTFHQDIIPYKLLLTMTAAREGIPFSALTEALVMVITFELLREAGIRMPRAIGQAISIVGALVIGDAAVKAGLVSTPMIIVIAVTAISSFIVSSLSGTFLFMRIVLMLAANIIGILGILLVSVAFFIHMCQLKSFGVNFLSPFTPLSISDLKDTFVRVPLWAMFTRPKELTWEHGGNAKFRNRHKKEGR
ncbi:MAG TPA: spore germination protein [Pseudobacteroides sp.]|uniref:spore germination protein n=1 Tax=Pseudobacteroides sp. TaxID=1968840 RepID=UPI002F9456AF